MSQEATLGPMVSLVQNADDALPSLSELESGLILAGYAFECWMVRCVAAAAILVLHSCIYRERPKRLAGLRRGFGIEGTHLVIYAVKKLEKLISATQKGKGACKADRPVCEALLTESVKGLAPDSATASTLRALSGHDDQSARAASAL